MIGRARSCLAAAALLAAGCGRDDQPLDGGRPLEFDTMPETADLFAADPCARREKGGWHRSIGHCEAMLPAREMQGVWVTAFEENSFFPGASERPDPRDPRRYTMEIELDDEAVLRSAGSAPNTLEGDAFYLRFSGRRTRDPIDVDCFGNPYFVFVVDQLIEVRHLGEMQPLPPTWFEDLMRNRPAPTVRRTHGGRWGELEARAADHCRPRGRGGGADNLEEAADDQSPAQARPPGKSSAE